MYSLPGTIPGGRQRQNAAIHQDLIAVAGGMGSTIHRLPAAIDHALGRVFAQVRCQ